MHGIHVLTNHNEKMTLKIDQTEQTYPRTTETPRLNRNAYGFMNNETLNLHSNANLLIKLSGIKTRYSTVYTYPIAAWYIIHINIYIRVKR